MGKINLAIPVRSAMPNNIIIIIIIIRYNNNINNNNNNNKAPETGEWVCGVGVGVRRGLRGASVPRWSA